MMRRSKYSAFIVAILIACLLGVWSFFIEPGLIRVNRVALEIPHWHEDQDLKIAILTDMHVGAPHITLKKLHHIVKTTNAEKPDIIVLLGDYVIQGVLGGHFVEPVMIAQALKNLKAPLGVISVLGNHDWWYDGKKITDVLQKAGIHVLENDVLRISNGDRPFWVGGLADMETRSWHFEEILEKTKKNQLPLILLTHNPDIFPSVPGRVSLTLAGHTHGGQVYLPLIGRPIIPSEFGQRYAIGHIIEQNKHMFVSSGLGTSIIPVRFRVVPEIVLMTLGKIS